MKRSRIAVLLLLLVIPFADAASQPSLQPAQRFYDMAVSAFERQDLNAADSLFTLSIDMYPNDDAYFNRGMTRRVMMDTCGYCNDMRTCFSFFDDQGALSNFTKDCLRKSDTVFITNKYTVVSKSEKYRFYDVFFTQACFTSPTGYIFDSRMKYDAFGAPRTSRPNVYNLRYYKTNIYAMYYRVRGGERIFTAFQGSSPPAFKGQNEPLVRNQIKQVLLTKQAKLKAYGKDLIVLNLVVDPEGELTDIKCNLEPLMDTVQFRNALVTIKQLLLDNFNFHKAKVLGEFVTTQYNFGL